MENKIEIIAEIAQGYEGNKKLADLLTEGALASNADAVKFQLVYADELATPDYQYYQLFKDLEMVQSIWENLCAQIHDKGKKVYFDVFGSLSLDIAKKLVPMELSYPPLSFITTAYLTKPLPNLINFIYQLAVFPLKILIKKYQN